jgi:hypothetical protein
MIRKLMHLSKKLITGKMQIRNLVSSWKKSREYAAKSNHQLSDLGPAEIVFMIFCIYGLFLATPFMKKDEDAV